MGEEGTERGASSSEVMSSPCPICLNPITQDAFLDPCFHKFCYNCILQWAKVVASKHSCQPSSIKCPLCKMDSFSIIYGHDGISFQQHHINHINQEPSTRAFFSRAHKFRLRCYYTEPGNLSETFNLSRYWKSHKYCQPSRWLQSWLKREIQSLVQEEDVDVIVHHILGVIDALCKRYEPRHQGSLEKLRREFKNVVSAAARPFLTARTDRFVDEMELFMGSGLNIDAYDDVYMQHMGWKTPEVTNEGNENPNRNASLVPYLYIFDEDSDDPD
ncbi:Zinc finger, C3HC4 RING-type [Dillenia turbinata]|uniref:Zinc finger, C3HC4 RING-type n=1 Tax=Dillenia turbinata TaxID=194707 RepID=A0AAN8UU53_9MAGN